jgi:hypothetical protein
MTNLTNIILEVLNANIPKKGIIPSRKSLKIQNENPMNNIPALLQIHLHAEGTS